MALVDDVGQQKPVANHGPACGERGPDDLGDQLRPAGHEQERLEACDRCPACQLVEAGTHPDYFAAGRPEDSPAIPIDVMRQLCKDFSLKSARGRGKVAVLDDADDLDDPITNHAAANCFLKTLEEPPPRSVFILVGSSPERQLPTVVSRCQVVRFAPLRADLMDTFLLERGIDDAGLRARLVALGRGSPGQALELADPALWEGRRALLDALARPRPDGVELARRWTELAEEAGKESAAQRRRAAQLLRLLLDFLEDALSVSLGDEARLRTLDNPQAVQQVARVGPDRLIEVLERCLDADYQIDRRVQLVLVLEALADALGQKLG